MPKFSFLLPLPPDILQVAYQDLVVDGSSEESRLEEVHAVQVRDVHSSLIGRRAVRAVLLNVHAEKTHIRSLDVLKCKQGFHPVGEGRAHLSTVNKPGGGKKSQGEENGYEILETSSETLSCCVLTIMFVNVNA